MKKKMPSWLRRKSVWFTIIVFISALALFAFRASLLRGAYAYLNVSEMPGNEFEYGLVLGGEPLDRPTAAADLYFAGKVKKIICTGSQIPRSLAAAGFLRTEAEISQQRLIESGVPQEDILLLPQATSTYEEALAINEFIPSDAKKNLLLITTESHTRRALGTFREYAGSWDDIQAYGVKPTHYEPHQWWKNEFGFLAIFEEYLKLTYYWFAY